VVLVALVELVVLVTLVVLVALVLLVSLIVFVVLVAFVAFVEADRREQVVRPELLEDRFEQIEVSIQRVMNNGVSHGHSPIEHTPRRSCRKRAGVMVLWQEWPAYTGPRP